MLKPDEKVSYYSKVCELVGLNPLTKPFDYIKLNGKEVLYANKGCTEQLRQVHKVSTKIDKVQTIEGVYVVTVIVSTPDGRTDSATGAVTIAGLKGESLANAFMKCETKAKRRGTLSICGLNMLDETEVETIPTAQEPEPAQAPAPIVQQPPLALPPSDVKPGDFSYEVPQGRTAIGLEIVKIAKELKLSKSAMADWVEDVFKKPLKNLSDAEMTQFLELLQKEL